jgi:hypothetical protein
VRSRGGWLIFFFLGLVVAAFVIEEFHDILRREVELSYFVPLLIGHGKLPLSEQCIYCRTNCEGNEDLTLHDACFRVDQLATETGAAAEVDSASLLGPWSACLVIL